MDVNQLTEEQAKKMLAGLINESYVVVIWPESQNIMEEPWFDECILDTESNFGSSAYFVPAHHMINYHEEKYLRENP
jgi:hypothetical protein